jgi:hypothetical protein
MKYDPDNIDHSELRARDFYEKRTRYQLIAHPNCRDPDHPGCDKCDDDIQDYEDDEDDIQEYK